jgi:DNA polymerase-3 subunit gamma/tau
MYRALYRKWRPATFNDVFGQEHVTSILKYQVESGRIPHAYLFCGSHGIGKTTCAKILAKAVNCLSPKDGNPCGECKACIAVENGAELDIIEMDAASNNRVEDIRDIRDDVMFAPANLKYRVYIIDEVHMLTTQAFNALLKTLEEPPPQLLFILATTELHKLPPTIISRCQKFVFKRVSVRDISERLLQIAKNEDISLTPGAAAMLARLSGGGVRDAIGYLELCGGMSRELDESTVAELLGIAPRKRLCELAKAVSKKNFAAIFESVERTCETSDDISVFWREFVGFYRDMLVIKAIPDYEQFLELRGEELTATAEAASYFKEENIISQLKIIDDAYADMQKAGGDKRIIAELALIKLCTNRKD